MRPSHQLARGIYRAPFASPNGARVLVGINRRGARVLEATVFDPRRLPEIEDALSALLDHEDPPRQLRIVR